MYKLQVSVSSILLLILVGCSTEQENLDAEVQIIRTFKSIELGGSATVRYKVQNLGNQEIRGWNIYFRVSMTSGKQVQVHHGLTYDLAVGEISEELLAYGKIPEHFDDVDEPSLATLHLIEVY